MTAQPVPPSNEKLPSAALAPAIILPAELPAGALSRPCDPASFQFETTNELPDLQDVIGQPRALRALELGSEVPGPGYNIFVLGQPGSGRTTLSQEYLQRKAESEPVPDDWCYVDNFEELHRPRALRLPAGRGVEFRKEMDGLIQHCQQDIPRTLESEEYTRDSDRIMVEVKKQQEAEFLRLQKHVEKYNFVIARTSFGYMLAPALEGKPLKPEEVLALTDKQRKKLDGLQKKLTVEVEKSLKLLRELERQAQEQIHELNTRTVNFLIQPVMEALKGKYTGLEGVLTHLEAVQADIVEHASQFRPGDGDSPGGPASAGWALRYSVNVLVDNSACKGAPVIVESHPSYHNLLGSIEHEVIMGATHTDFTMIRPGALHRANGGYLVVSARDVLLNPYAWEGLKRALRDGEARIIELGNQLSLLSTATLEPEPLPLQVKVVLVGTPVLYYMLRYYDEDFAKLFKVRAEFASLMKRDPQTEQEYGLFVKSVVMEHDLPPFDRSAVAKIVEYSSRLADDQDKLSTRFGKISDLVREAAYWARKTDGKATECPPQADGRPVTASEVQRAIQESVYRSNLVEERIQELIAEGTLMVDVSGQAVGQVNALSVLMLGDYEFGRPNRVTAAAYAGKGGVVDIERQAKLGGAVHTKGVLILTGLLGRLYGRTQPINLSASLTFEQSYEEVEGDSASTAEFAALLSAIADIPLRQDIALTGSINHHGVLQPIGGANEKIEGFFAACKRSGLTSEQGVILPVGNLRHLMLQDEVIEAVRERRFHLWAVASLDEVLALLTGVEPGVRQPDGSYPPGSFHAAVMGRLAAFSKALEGGVKAAPAVGNAAAATPAAAPSAEGIEGAPAQPEDG
jgi:lon-related putative ATP-dependent protease